MCAFVNQGNLVQYSDVLFTKQNWLMSKNVCSKVSHVNTFCRKVHKCCSGHPVKHKISAWCKLPLQKLTVNGLIVSIIQR